MKSNRPLWLSPAVLATLAVFTAFGTFVLPSVAVAGATEPDLLEAEKAFQLTGRLRDEKTIEISYAVADGYYMYRDRFRFAVNGQPVKLGSRQLPAGKVKQDATFGKVVTYRSSVRILLPIPLSALPVNANGGTGKPIELKVTSQGCADAGVCYPPLHQQLAFLSGSSSVVSPTAESTTGSFSRPAASQGSVGDILKRGR
jgi:thioredoxin:protein disulfide reductase